MNDKSENIIDALRRIHHLPAQFNDDISAVTEQNLLQRLLIGLERMDLDEAKKTEILDNLCSSTREFFQNCDHGLAFHCPAVQKRALFIFDHCPQLRERIGFDNDLNAVEFKYGMTWAAILHDCGRFLGNYDCTSHQVFGANLAKACFRENVTGYYCGLLYEMIIHHDYLRFHHNRKDFPPVFFSPIAEIFRLADKTSVSAVEEIERYHATGRRLFASDWPICNPKISDFERFEWLKTDSNRDKWDQLQYDLLFFIITPDDWYYGETRDLYREWADDRTAGKSKAAERLIQMAEENGEDTFIATQALYNFFKKAKLPQYVG